MSQKRRETSGHGKAKVRVIDCNYFDARGMLRVYGQTDHYGRRAFNMDIWLKRDGRLLMRFWSRSSEVDEASYEIVGLEPAEIPVPQPGQGLDSEWVPEAVWQEFENWVISEI